MNNHPQSQLAQLKKAYQEKLPERLRALETVWKSLTVNFNKAQFLDFYRAVHSLHGSAGTFGFTGLSKALKDLEIYLQQLLNHTTLNATQTSEISHLLNRTQDFIAEKVVEPLILEKAVASHLILYLVHEVGAFEKNLQKNLKLVGYQLVCVRTLPSLQKKLEQQLPIAVLLEGSHLENEAVIQLMAFYRQRYQLNSLCLAEKDDIPTRLKASRAQISIFFHKPVDLYSLTNRLIQLGSFLTRESYRVLIVDDYYPLAEYYASILTETGMTAQTLTEPLELMHTLQDFNPNLLILDLYLPGCTGCELAKIIRQEEQYVGLPIIFISTENDRFKQLRILNECGGDDFLTKPVLPQNLVAAVKSRAQRSALLSAHLVQDSLTQVLNHAHFLAQLKFEILRAKRRSELVSLAMLDLDNFKKINDSYGHPTGDLVLKKVAELVASCIRQTDFLGRYGGEEFAIIFPNTALKEAQRICKEVLEVVASHAFEVLGHLFQVTLSIGLAEYPTYKTKDSLIVAADKALYQAKRKGRRRIEIMDKPSC